MRLSPSNNSFFASPFWDNIKRELERAPQFSRGGGTHHVAGHTIAKRLLSDRINCIRQACNDADYQTMRRLRVALAGLGIEPILFGLLDTLKEVVLIVGGSIGIGSFFGAGIGAFFGGVGAIPGGAVGAALGAEVGMWILGALGLKNLAEFIIDSVPQILASYYAGFSTAWRAGYDPVAAHPSNRSEQPFQISIAAGYIADGHVAMVLLLLNAITLYLMRGKSIQALAKEARGGRLGDKFANWMLQNEDQLRRQRKLQEQRGMAVGGAVGDAPARKPAPSHNRDAREAQPARPKMAQKKVRCFEPNDLPQAKIPEFDRQLTGQERGLNGMTVEEYLKGRDAFESREMMRNPKVARAARLDYEKSLSRDLSQQLEFEGLSPKQAKAKAVEMAAEKMKTLAALHNPDMYAGGKDVIGDFGDRNVNSRIGAQWKTKGRVIDLDKTASLIPVVERATTKMNVKLERCK